MSLINKLKNIFKKEDEKLSNQKEILPPAEWKYGNMIIVAPEKSVFYEEESYFYIDAFDENNKPIANETISIKIGSEEINAKTDENGNIKIPTNNFKVKRYPVLVKYPNGDYSQIIKSKLVVRRKRKRKTKNNSSPIPQKETDNVKKDVMLNTHNMKMYINNEGQFFARLRDTELNPIVGEEIIFSVNNEKHAIKTDNEGFARWDVANLKNGIHDVLVEFKGNSEYKSKSKEKELEMIIRDIDKEIMIEVDHLSMEFKVTKDKIDTLKEFIIRTIKRNKTPHEKIKVLDDISFKVYKGDRLGILGFNGAGKSTLLKIMSGIYEPTSGTIKTNGKIAPLLELGAGFDKNYTGKNNIYLNGSLLSIDEKFIDEKYDEIVEFSELGEFINYPIKNYSSGMRTKLGFSIATLINPDILIIDEILSVGDIKFKKKSAEKINSMMKEGVTVLLVSHSIAQIEKICDTCIWLENGKIRMQGDATTVCEAYVKGAKKD